MKFSTKEKHRFGNHTLEKLGIRFRRPPTKQWPVPLVTDIGSMGLLLARTFRLIITARTDRGDTLKLTHRYANGALSFVFISMSFVGMIMVYQSTEQLARAIGDTHLVGPSFLKLLIRVLGPTIIGMLIACRVGAGIAAEIGAMAVTEQLDAMRICSADPVEVLMVPRLRAAILASLSLVLLGGTACGLAGWATSAILYGTSAGTFWNFSLVGLPDLVQGMTKALVYGIVIPIISGASGFAARGGAQGVGEATTRAVVGSSFAIVLFDSIISLIGYMLGY